MSRLLARALSLTLLASESAQAEAAAPHADSAVEVADCPTELASPLPAAVRLELDVLLRERGATRAPPDRVSIRCAGDRARIEVTMQGEGRESSVDVGALSADHRARAIALATAELVHSMSSSVPEVPPPVAPPKATTAAVPPPAEQEESNARRRAWQRSTLAVGGVAHWLGTPVTVLFGARAAFRSPISDLLVPALSLEGSAGGFHAHSAQISIATLSVGAALGFGLTTGSVRVEVGPGARFGWIRLAGEPDAGVTLEGHALSAAWGGPEARARVAVSPSPGRSPFFALELGAGFVALPVHGLVDGTERVYAVDGPWLSVGAEVGFGM
jgi:hypothetical protein